MNHPERQQSAFEIIAIAASAGGVNALSLLLARLPARLGAVVVIVQHVDPRHRSLMPQVIGRQSPMPVMHGEEGMQLEPDHVFLAPPDRHMLIKRKGTLTLTDSELVNFVRPSADLLFESVAAAYGDRAIAVVLTGSGHDGALGVTAIKQRGGTVVAQDEASSEFFGMPSAAIKTGAVDFVLPLEEIAPTLTALVAAQAGE
ncbi:MAG: chemotaxis protein CheB [Chloroflexi bacterium 13_1_20CM_4_66_7]|nr:MAG: chemotaxis protein CheB [Chloroflexi bacterium 13_1_20CM_4_66_7]